MITHIFHATHPFALKVIVIGDQLTYFEVALLQYYSTIVDFDCNFISNYFYNYGSYYF